MGVVNDDVTDDVYRYIQAAASPKDIVILVDTSGSMKGLRIEIAKATVEKIVETLSDDDFFNVVKVLELKPNDITMSTCHHPFTSRQCVCLLVILE